MKISKKSVLKFMKSPDYSPSTLKELCRTFKIMKKDQKKKLRAILEELIKEGVIFRDSRGRYRQIGDNLVFGKLEFTRRGTAAYLTTPDGESVFVPIENVKDAMHGDKVVVEIVGRRGLLKKGMVLQVVERALKKVVGVFETRGLFGFVVPVDPKVTYDFYVSSENFGGAHPGQLVVAEVINYPTKSRNPEARIVSVLGDVNDPQNDLPIVMVKHNLPEKFPEDVVEEAKKIPTRVYKRDVKDRKDFRNEIVFTIDGEDAKDFDDAVSIKRLENGNYLLGVHIADVSHYVKENSALDKEAYNRGTSVYLIDTVIPMLPFKLSNGICSLVEGKDRLTMSVEMEINPKGDVVNQEISESVIRSVKRLTYTEVNQLLEDNDKEVEKRLGRDISEKLRLMAELARILRNKRKERGAIIDIKSDEVKIILNDKKWPVDIIPRKRGIAEILIEEFMIKANETVAEIFDKFDLPFIYRVHEEPEPEEIMELKMYLSALGIKATFPKKIHPGALQKLLEATENHPLRSSVERLLVRSMKRALYSETNIGHFGLASYSYTHFTSPIRRYPDLVVHRLLKKFLKSEKLSEEQLEKVRKKLLVVAKHCSERERKADEAEWDLVAMKKVEYISQHIGEVFDVVVTSVTKFGLFVEIPEKAISGLIHISTLDDYFIYDEQRNILVGERTRKVYRLGDKIKARVVSADKIRMEIDFEVVEEEKNEGSSE